MAAVRPPRETSIVAVLAVVVIEYRLAALEHENLPVGEVILQTRADGAVLYEHISWVLAHLVVCQH